jgi:ubiquinone/menaquinone biosynthesis C-methylase UbiE
VILTLNSYRALYGNETISTRLGAALASLHAILMEHTLLFIGFSFADPYVRRQMEWLAGTFHNSGGPHYALFHESQIADAKSALKEFSIVCLGFTDYGDPLRDLVREISNGAGTSQSPTISPVDLHPNPVTLPIEMRWSVARDLRRSVLDLITPTYLLDDSYHFLDWNPAFDIIVARQLRLRRGHHALDFVEKLVNSKQSEVHAKMAFCEGNVPLVDMEPLLFQSEEYGLIKFWKVACQITEGGVSAWSVSLNILDAERLGDLWDAIRRKLRERVNWSAYSLVYDKILLRFARYNTLVQKVAGRLQGLGTCADLGAGTGNGTIQLRRQNPSMTIYAIEPNDQMLTQMVSKLNDEKMYPSNNLFVIKQGIENLSELQEEFFDGAMMINVLYAVDDPELCLKEVARVLKKGAPLVLTTPHEKTSIDRLFNVMRDEFRESGIYEELKDGVEQAYVRHQSMLAKIHRYTIEDIQGQLEQSGFDIEDFEPREYTGAVILAHCVKR